MKKIAAIIAFGQILFGQIDAHPDKVTREDLEILKSFEKRIYMKTKVIGQKEATFNEILSYITKHKLAKKPSGLQVELQGSAGLKNYTGLENSERAFYQAGILLRYKVIDKKEENDLKLKQMKLDQEIAQNVALYFKTKNDLNALIKKLEMLRLIDRRLKVRVRSGIENLDDRLKVLQQILDTNDKINEERVNLFKLKALLVTYVEDDAKDKLREML